MIADAKKAFAERRKLATYAVGLVSAAVTLGVLHGQALDAALAFEALLTGWGIHAVPNA